MDRQMSRQLFGKANGQIDQNGQSGETGQTDGLTTQGENSKSDGECFIWTKRSYHTRPYDICTPLRT